MESLEIDQTCTKGSEPEKGSTVVHDEDVDEQNPKGTELEETTTISQPKEGGDQHDHEEDFVKETTDSVLCSKGNDVEGASKVVGEGDGIPRVGMKFDSEHDAYNFYNAYATRIGFIVRRAKVGYTANGALWQCYYFCSNQGLKVDSRICPWKDNELEMRTDCKARICFEVTDGAWEVTHFNLDQNHTLADSEQRKFLRSYGKALQKRSSTSKSSLDGENPEEDEGAWSFGNSNILPVAMFKCHMLIRITQKGGALEDYALSMPKTVIILLAKCLRDLRKAIVRLPFIVLRSVVMYD